MKLTDKQRNELLDALNVMDEFAGFGVEEGNEEESTDEARCYNVLFDFISKHD